MKFAGRLRHAVFPTYNPEPMPEYIIQCLLEIQDKARISTGIITSGDLLFSELSQQVCFPNSHESIGASAKVPLIWQSILEALASQDMKTT